MRYLKSHKIFESEKIPQKRGKLWGDLEYSDVEWIKHELEDVLLELNDEGFNSKVTFNKDYKMHLFVQFLDYQSEKASWDDINDCVERVNKIADKFIPVGVYYKIMQPDGRIYNRNEREYISLGIHYTDELPNVSPINDAIDVIKFNLRGERRLCFFSIEYVEFNAKRSFVTIGSREISLNRKDPE